MRFIILLISILTFCLSRPNLLGRKRNRDNDDVDDEIGLILENSKEWKKVYQTSTTRINYFDTYTCENTEQCFQEFEKNLQKYPDKVKDLGNGGFVALINDMEKIKIYQYGRRYGSLGEDHTEPDLLSIFEKIKMQKGYILISSYYAACPSCLEKIICFLKDNPELRIRFYFKEIFNLRSFKISRYLNSTCKYFTNLCIGQKKFEKCLREKYESIRNGDNTITNLYISKI